MAKKSFTDENKSKTFEGYPKLKLKTGEKARICVIEDAPEAVFKHVYRPPVVINGEIQMETKQGKRGEYQTPRTEFMGQFRCSGTYEKVAAEGIDPENCEQCQWVKSQPDKFEAPQRAFGQHILKYKTLPGDTAIASPFQVEVVAWVYTDARFDFLVDTTKEHGDLRLRDLLVTCTNGDWNKFEIQVGGKCEWIADEERKQFTDAVYKNSLTDNMEDVICRAANATSLALVYDKVIGRFSLIGKADGAGEVNISDVDMSSLFSNSDPKDAPSWAQPEADESDLHGAPIVHESSESEEPAPAPKAKDKLADFNSFLQDLA